MLIKRILASVLLLVSSLVNAQPQQLPKRIIALAPHIVENLYAIGAGERIVGTVEHADYPEAAKKIPRIGGFHGIQLEKVLALRPDLVVVWKNGNKEADIEKLKALGIPVAYSTSKDIHQVPKELMKLGELTGREVQAKLQAEKFLSEYQQLVDTYQRKEALDVFYQLWPSPLMTINGKTWIHQTLTICGVRNVFADATTEYPQISLENVIAKHPQAIVIPNERAEKQPPKVDWQLWQEIPAVKHQQYIEVDADLLHRFSTRMLIGVRDMCDKLHASRTYYGKRQ
ncbi:cobalamin-binding protein [Pseudoalteromonas luteoviolacea]|uniref:Cobalamin-binding protein n=1 Tax=Pseudoalteromonas luteoviolacea TaxID=43657 RepID=A0A1C0TNM9_9GAMM|nr:cobalamin-binding protein [Pseudoalteromonas luteoviolacea]OCQ20541.1 cobalamin-binding protein [Pseudoalteromonas luteoviolacea]